MSILEELTAIMESAGLPIETGVFSGQPLDEYVVLTPLADTFGFYGDDMPLSDVQEVRISLFSKTNYITRKNQLTKMLLQADFTITTRQYIGHEDDSNYHHYSIDVAKNYDLQED